MRISTIKKTPRFYEDAQLPNRRRATYHDLLTTNNLSKIERQVLAPDACPQSAFYHAAGLAGSAARQLALRRFPASKSLTPSP
jgi:hypothetical protein